MTRKPTQNWTIENRGFTTACWIWCRGRTRLGYGKIKRNGMTLLAHRVAWMRERGSIPEGLEVDHLCRNRACVNPAHLELVTHAENVQRGALAKLSAADVINIRRALSQGRRPVDIAEDYGVRRDAITDIRRGRTWRDVH